MRFTSYLGLGLLVCAALAQADGQPKSHSSHVMWEPPDWNVPENLKPVMPKELLISLKLAGYNVALEKTDMQEAQRRLGGQIGSRESDAEEWLCFHGVNNAGRWILWLESSEMSPSLVGSFQWRELSKRDVPDPRCQSLPAKAAITLPVSSLTLGVPESQVLNSLGPPTSKDGRKLMYLHRHNAGGTSGMVFFSSNVVVVQVRDGIVWAIQASNTTSD